MCLGRAGALGWGTPGSSRETEEGEAGVLDV